MFKEAKNAMERTLYMAVSPKTYENIKQIAKVGAVGGVLTAAASFVPQALNKILAYAAFDEDRRYYCDSNNLNLEKADYAHLGSLVSSKVKAYLTIYPDAGAQQIGGSVNGVDTVAKMNYCLQTNDINPDSVVHLHPKLAEAVNLYISAIPEFPDSILKPLIFTGAIGGLIAIPKIVNYVRGAIKRKREN